MHAFQDIWPIILKTDGYLFQQDDGYNLYLVDPT